MFLEWRWVKQSNLNFTRGATQSPHGVAPDWVEVISYHYIFLLEGKETLSAGIM